MVLTVVRSIGALTVLLILACGNASSGEADAPPPTEGEMVYNTNCATCHGRSGDLGMSGAKNLATSTIPRQEVTAIVTNGKAGMMPYGKSLSKKQLEAVVDTKSGQQPAAH
jgi:cytochrome c6